MPYPPKQLTRQARRRIERDHQDDKTQTGRGWRPAQRALQIHWQKHVEADDPQPNECAAIANSAAGSARIAIGMSGSIAVRRRKTKPAPNTSAQTSSAAIGSDSHG